MRNTVDSNEETRDAVVALLCDELEKGISIKVACDLVGISHAAYYRWRRRAEEGDDEAIQIMRRLATARARGFEQHVGKIKATADQTEDWRARAWLVDKLYPNWVGRIEEIEYAFAEQQDGKPNGWSTPEQLRLLVLMAAETGVLAMLGLSDDVLRELRQAAAGQLPQIEQRERPSIEQPRVDPLERIRDAVIDALADGPRELTELREVVCALTSCSHDQFKQACAGLEFEQQLSPGQPTLVRLADTQRISRTNESAVPPTAEPQIRTDDPGSPAEDRGSSSWLAGKPGDGVGDYIARRRGR
jgi:hypothetical protein